MVKTKINEVVNNNPYLKELDSIQIPKISNGFSYASVFCGGGGLDLGFSASGFQPLFSSDIEQTYCDTIKENLKGHIVEKHDISELSGNDVLNKVGQKIDLIIGGPPCQSFSILGSRGSVNDPRGKLAYEYARFIREINPQAFLFENVPGILTVNKGQDWKDILKFFKDETKYFIKWTKLNAVSYGTPQNRQRVVAVGFKKEKHYNNFDWPYALHFENNESPEEGKLPPRISSLALDQIGKLPNHVFRKHGERVITRYSKVPPGGRDKKDHTDRIHPDKPSGTVLVGSGAGGGRPFIHPFENRHITVREAARLQSFPDWWEFSGGPTAAYRQVGNAVPPMMAKAIANQIYLALRNNNDE